MSGSPPLTSSTAPGDIRIRHEEYDGVPDIFDGTDPSGRQAATFFAKEST